MDFRPTSISRQTKMYCLDPMNNYLVMWLLELQFTTKLLWFFEPTLAFFSTKQEANRITKTWAECYSTPATWNINPGVSECCVYTPLYLWTNWHWTYMIHDNYIRMLHLRAGFIHTENNLVLNDEFLRSLNSIQGH